MITYNAVQLVSVNRSIVFHFSIMTITFIHRNCYCLISLSKWLLRVWLISFSFYHLKVYVCSILHYVIVLNVNVYDVRE